MNRTQQLGVYAPTDLYIHVVGEAIEQRNQQPYYSPFGSRIYAEITSGTYKGKVILFGHLESMDVESRETIKAGECIGIIGNSGNSTGRHLHFELFPDMDHLNGNNHIDPRPLLLNSIPVTNTEQTSGGGYLADYSSIYNKPYKHKGVDLRGAIAGVIPGWETISLEFLMAWKQSISF